jgi:hypothetical protein
LLTGCQLCVAALPLRTPNTHALHLLAAAPLLYTDSAQRSRFIKALPRDVQKALQVSPIAMENHMKGAGDGDGSHTLPWPKQH